MKSIATILIIVFSATLRIFAQVPNGDFENWETNSFGILEPVSWFTYNLPGSVTVNKVLGYNSAKGAELAPVEFNGTVSTAVMISETFAISQRYATLKCYVKGILAVPDTLLISIGLTRHDSVIAAGAYYSAASYMVYTPVEIPLFYWYGGIPDSADIAIMVGNEEGGTLGSSFAIDGLTMEGTAGTDAHNQESFTTGTPYPQPATGTVNIPVFSTDESQVSLKIYSPAGQLVSVTKHYPPSTGYFTIHTDVTGLKPGIYIYNVENNDGLTISGKLTIN
jgi:hypothetical protein